MASKLTKAVKAWAHWNTMSGDWWAWTGIKDDAHVPVYIVPAAEYERLTKVDKLAAQLMEHEACVSECDKCKERRKISDQLARVVSVRRKRARNAK